MSNQAKAYIQKSAIKRFPAQELWFNEENYTFWAYLVEDDNLFSTTGKFEGGNIIYETKILNHTLLEDIMQNKQNQGYECFAILL